MFNLPPWVKKLSEDTEKFNMLPPSYEERTRVIIKMKSSGSTCSFVQISVLALKHCPILRTNLHRIIKKCWELGFTILIYKKDSPGIPGNFNLIPLESKYAKVFTSLVKNRTYAFLVKNNHTETIILKQRFLEWCFGEGGAHGNINIFDKPCT